MEKPRLFISAVSRELKTARQRVANILTRKGYEPVWQDIFGTEPGDLRAMLRKKIDSCRGLIQLVGEAYGASDGDPDPEFGLCSWTQFEFFHAQKQGKATWLLILGAGVSRDTPPGELDLPDHHEASDPAAWQRAQRQRQRDYLVRSEVLHHLRHYVSDDTSLDLSSQGIADTFRASSRKGCSFTLSLTFAALTALAGWLAARHFTSDPDQREEVHQPDIPQDDPPLPSPVHVQVPDPEIPDPDDGPLKKEDHMENRRFPVAGHDPPENYVPKASANTLPKLADVEATLPALRQKALADTGALAAGQEYNAQLRRAGDLLLRRAAKGDTERARTRYQQSLNHAHTLRNAHPASPAATAEVFSANLKLASLFTKSQPKLARTYYREALSLAGELENHPDVFDLEQVTLLATLSRQFDGNTSDYTGPPLPPDDLREHFIRPLPSASIPDPPEPTAVDPGLLLPPLEEK